MARQRVRDTSPELSLRRRLHARGLRYRVQARILPGVRRTIDIVFPRERVAVEVRGCFWHGCSKHRSIPKANNAWWASKLASNVARDADTADRLERAGWTLVVVWEHDDPDAAAERVEMTVRSRRSNLDSATSHNLRPAVRWDYSAPAGGSAILLASVDCSEPSDTKTRCPADPLEGSATRPTPGAP
jgi:DNA mismatch endonuclease (patch repair protein)